MNGEAARLQACDTHAANTSGLDARGQLSSAYDLALFGRAALADPQIARILATTRYRFPAAGTAFDQRRKRFEIQNHNRLLRNYPGATGVKNGFTELARGAFVGSAQRAGHRYVVTLAHAEGNTWHQAAALLDWAFAAGARHPATAGIGRLVDPAGPHGADGCRPEPAVLLGAPGAVTPAAAPATGAIGPPTDGGETVAIPTRWLITVSASLLALIAAGVRLRRRGPRSGPPAS
jgi:D-alanyl-D-alanine carboxypeptidase (penicillin-binding protein 5/6)